MSTKLLGPFGDEAIAALIAAALSAIMWIWGRFSNKPKNQYIFWRVLDFKGKSLNNIFEPCSLLPSIPTRMGNLLEGKDCYLKLRLFNQGPLLIENPNIGINFNNEVDIKKANVKYIPERSNLIESDLNLKYKKNELLVSTKKFYPFSEMQEEIELEIETTGILKELNFTGHGNLTNKNIWQISMEPSQQLSPSYGSCLVSAIFLFNIFILFLVTLIYFIINPPKLIFELLVSQLSNPLGIFFGIWLILFIFWLMRTALKGYQLRIRIPFTHIVFVGRLYNKYRRR